MPTINFQTIEGFEQGLKNCKIKTVYKTIYNQEAIVGDDRIRVPMKRTYIVFTALFENIVLRFTELLAEVGMNEEADKVVKERDVKLCEVLVEYKITMGYAE